MLVGANVRVWAPEGMDVGHRAVYVLKLQSFTAAGGTEKVIGEPPSNCKVKVRGAGTGVPLAG